VWLAGKPVFFPPEIVGIHRFFFQENLETKQRRLDLDVSRVQKRRFFQPTELSSKLDGVSNEARAELSMEQFICAIFSCALNRCLVPV
jgi:hypothetical protein